MHGSDAPAAALTEPVNARAPKNPACRATVHPSPRARLGTGVNGGGLRVRRLARDMRGTVGAGVGCRTGRMWGEGVIAKPEAPRPIRQFVLAHRRHARPTARYARPWPQPWQSRPIAGSCYFASSRNARLRRPRMRQHLLGQDDPSGIADLGDFKGRVHTGVMALGRLARQCASGIDRELKRNGYTVSGYSWGVEAEWVYCPWIFTVPGYSLSLDIQR